MKLKDNIMPSLVLTLICAAIAFLLGTTNEITKEKIAANELEAANAARLIVLPGASDFNDITDAVAGAAEQGFSVYEEASGKGFAVTTFASGYGGAVTVVTGIDANGQVTGVHTLSSSETPGLGKKTEDAAFTQQYLGKAGPFQVVKNTASADDEIVAVTGATISSKAVTEAVNMAVELCASYAGRS